MAISAAVRVLPDSDPVCVKEAAALLRRGELVCYPTDTVYGIGAAAGNEAAVRHLFAAKGRSPDKALPLLVGDTEDIERVARVTPLARGLIERFWPGGLTIVMKKADGFASAALAGSDSVALRLPDHELIREIVRALGEPITGTSANWAGEPPPRTAAAVVRQLGESVSLVIDGGRCRQGIESTVIDITSGTVEILREGAVSREEIERALGRRVEAGR